ncbi:MAG: hypothetical protein QF535_23485, partial [Anaerolineales bacterium]|nr:hypothetical protein [Anaerolineales bacterium]
MVVQFASEGAEAKDYEWKYETSGQVTNVAISDDGKYLVSASYDDKINFFETDSSTPDWSYSLDTDENFVDISANGYYIANIGNGENLKLFSRDSNSPNWTASSTEGWAVAISDDGNYIVSGNGDTIALYSTSSSTAIWTYDANEGAIVSIDTTPTASKIVVGTDDGLLLEFNRNSSTPVVEVFPIGTWAAHIKSVSISDNGEYFVASVTREGVNPGDEIERLYLYGSGDEDYLDYVDTDEIMHSVSINSDGQYFASCGSSANTRLYSRSADGGITQEWSNNTSCGGAGNGKNKHIAISSDGEYIAATGSASEGEVRFFS